MNNAPGDKVVNLQEKKQVQEKNLARISGMDLQAELTPAVLSAPQLQDNSIAPPEQAYDVTACTCSQDSSLSVHFA